MIYAFNERGKMESIEGSAALKAYRLLEAKGSWKALSKDEKEQVLPCFGELWNHDPYVTGRIRLMGMMLDFTEWMETFWVDTQHYGIRKIRSFSKMAIRLNAAQPHMINRIVEV